MRTFTIDEQSNITVLGSQEEAAAATGLTFSSKEALGKLSTEWPVGRFVEIWNGFAGVAPFGELKPVKKFTDRKTAVARIWQAIQWLGSESAASSIPDEALPETAAIVSERGLETAPEPIAEVPTEIANICEVAAAPELATLAPQVPDVAPELATATSDANPVENAPAATAVAESASTEQTATKQTKRKKAPKPAQESGAPRETKLSQVVAMLQRPEGATITEIMTKMGWLKHTVRGFMAGTMMKAGSNVESFKPEGGERSYRIPSK